MFEWIKTILILPFNALVVIPSLILYFSDYKFHPPVLWQIIVGLILFFIGFSIAIWTMVLFAKIGKGTAAFWSPPKNLVISGPYCYVRNPMIVGAILVLIAETLILSSKGIFLWLIVFYVCYSIFFLLIEEKDLINRFGDYYILYKNNVPSWFPKLTKWTLPK